MLGALAVALAGFAGPASAAAISGCTPGKAPTEQVASVIDGGALKLADGRTVTIAGIDAPLPPIAAPDRPTALSSAASEALARAVGSGTVKVAVIGDKPDRYGRWRANVFTAEGKSIAADLVTQGYARVHRETGDPQCVLALLDVERQARIEARGMWSDAQYKIRSALDPSLGDETGLYELVAGQVLSIGHGDVVIFVNFGRDYSHDFTVTMTPAVAKSLAAAGIDVDQLAGKRVVVRGMIEASGGPAIRIGEATDIEVLADAGD